MIADGIHYDLPEDAYHADPAISNSGLSLVAKSPAHYRQRAERVTTATLERGRALHALVLEGRREYVVQPAFAGTGAVARRNEWKAEHAGKAIISQADADAVDGMALAIAGHSFASRLVTSAGRSEVSLFWTENGTRCKARLDKLLDSGVIVDLKSARDASPEGFARSVASYRYHCQDAWYRRGCRALGIDPKGFVFVAVESVAPHGVGCYVLDDASREVGEKLTSAALATYREAVATNVWRTYTDQALTISIPAWAHYAVTEEE
jgi:hypothetical protein